MPRTSLLCRFSNERSIPPDMPQYQFYELKVRCSGCQDNTPYLAVGGIKRPTGLFAIPALSTLSCSISLLHLTHPFLPSCPLKPNLLQRRLPLKLPRPRAFATTLLLSVLTPLLCRKRGRGRPPKQAAKNPFIDDAASDDEGYLSIFSCAPPSLMCHTAPSIFLTRRPAAPSVLLGIRSPESLFPSC